MAKKTESPEQSGKRNGDGKPGGDGKPVGGTVSPQAAAPEGTAPETGPRLNVLGQYIKDLSFESPHAPQTLQSPPPNPQLQVTVNVNVAGQSEETYEVVLNIDVHAKSDVGVIYNVELFYAGLFRLRNVPQNLLQPVLFVDCPALLFPFTRRVLADITRDGGYPPLMLDPIDFGRLYSQNLARGQGQASN
ncbi:MAG TPA: protein-export chaperone SecB [Methyloceanibacter sp.]|nr:protein-export chaperone SecB [Methyloceanibacter sp.]